MKQPPWMSVGGWAAVMVAVCAVVFLPATGILAFGLAMCLLFISRRWPPEDRGWLVRMAVAGWLARLMFILVYYVVVTAHGAPDTLGPDGQAYAHRGWYLALLARGRSMFEVPNQFEHIFKGQMSLVQYYQERWPDWRGYQFGAYTVLMGACYALLGYDPLLFRALNSAFGVGVALLGYGVGRSLGGRPAGRLTMGLLTWMPSLFVFSTTNLRDAPTVFLGMLLLWSLVRYAATRRWTHLAISVAAILLGNTLREFFSVILLLVTASALFVLWGRRLRQKLVCLGAAAAMLAWAPITQPLTGRVSSAVQRELLDPTRLFSSHIGYVNTPGANYRILPDRCYAASSPVTLTPAQQAAAVASGTVHVLLEPALTMRGRRAAVLAVLASIHCFGLALALWATWRLWPVMVPLLAPLLAYLGLLIVLLAISEGNAGTAFRHRDLLMPAVAPLAAAGWSMLPRRATEPR